MKKIIQTCLVNIIALNALGVKRMNHNVKLYTNVTKHDTVVDISTS